MLNKIEYGDYTFTDDDFLNGTINIENAMVSETLASDMFTFTCKNEANLWNAFITDDPEEFVVSEGAFYCSDREENLKISDFEYGEPVYYYHNDKLVGKFYIKTARRIATNHYEVECVSAVGLLINIKYRGGIYTGETISSVLADLLSGINYRCDSDVGNIKLYGHLKIQDKRSALQQILFSCGASVLKEADGSLHIGYNQPSKGTVLSDDNIYMGGSIDYLTPASKVLVTEHSFYRSDSVEDTVLFDNSTATAADHSFIEFSNPCHSLVGTGITIHESGANYVVISGTGILKGKEYVHIKRILEKSTGTTGEEREVSVTDATLINSINSNNCLERVASYYSQATETSVGIKVTSEKPGDLIEFNDPFGDKQQGYIKSMDINISTTLKAESVVATNWKPGHLGNNFTKSIIIKDSDLVNGQFTVPTQYVGKPALAVLFGGGSGGSGGYDGKSGGTSKYKYNHTRLPNGVWLSGASWALGGDGGNPGIPGECGNIFSFSIDALASSYPATIGIGGAGGAKNGVEGQPGTHTTFGTHTTEEGTQFAGNYIDLITGAIYAKSGESQNGYAGGAGGPAGWDGSFIQNGGGWSPGDAPYNWGHHGRPGEDIGPYKGGQGALFVSVDRETSSHGYRLEGHGSGGGGSAWGANGSNAESSTQTSTYNQSSQYASKPGNGANAVAPADETLGSAGRAGNGGGGGGARGPLIYYRDGYEESYSNYTTSATPGNGSIGGKGGDGFILLYV